MRTGIALTKVPKISKAKKPIASFTAPTSAQKLVPDTLKKAINQTSESEPINIETTSDDMGFDLHANDPEWVIEFNRRFEEQARRNANYSKKSLLLNTSKQSFY
jgi:hypothetical protein